MGRRIIIVFTLLTMHIAAFAQSAPFPTDNLQLWLRADSVELTDGKVSRWYDLSPNQYEIVQTNIKAMPSVTENALNGQPALTFSGKHQLVGPIIAAQNGKDWTFFTVAKTFAHTSSKQSVFCNGSPGEPYFRYRLDIDQFTTANPTTTVSFTNKINDNIFSIIAFDYVNKDKSSNIFVNMTRIGSASYRSEVNFDNANLKIGAYSNSTTYPLNGQIAEIIAVNSIDSALRNNIYSYLINKYSTQVYLGSNINIPYGFADTTIVTAYNPDFVHYSWNTGETSSIIHVNKPGSYWVTVTNGFNITSSDTINVYYPEPEQLADTTICAGDTLVWNAALNGPYTYLWSDGSTEKSLLITTAGEYYVTITDTAGYSWKSDTIMVAVDSFPVTAGLEGDHINSCIGNNIYLQSGYDEAVGYLWSDGSKDDHLAVTTSGIYWVRATDKLGCIATDTAQIEVLGIAPTPDFTHTALCATRNIEFESQSHSNDTSKINGYLWQFGDGETSTAANPVHAYSYSGTYSMQLIVSTTNGCSNVLKKNLIVDSLPTAAFAPAQACSYTPVQFADLSSTPVGYLTQWQWTMNDSVFAERNPSTTFNTAGDMPVQLVVTTAHGCTDTLRSTISILQGPMVDFDCSAPCLNAPLYCTNKTVSALNLAISHVWQIDGEQKSTVRSPSFNFSDTGNYRITLTARQLSNGCSASKSKTISVRPLPKPIISAGLICQNQPVHVKAENREPGSVVNSWLWTIDGKQNTKGQTKMLTFESAGKHQLTVTATDTVGCENKTDTAVVVRPTPSAAFSITPERGPVPFDPTFINRSADADSYQWILDNTFASADEELQYTFADSGSHIVGLIAVNQYGCADTALRTMVAFVPSTDLLIMQAEAEPVGT